jgi:hypothetical protein
LSADLKEETSGVVFAGVTADSRTSHGFGSSSSYLFSSKNTTED